MLRANAVSIRTTTRRLIVIFCPLNVYELILVHIAIFPVRILKSTHLPSSIPWLRRCSLPGAAGGARLCAPPVCTAAISAPLAADSTLKLIGGEAARHCNVMTALYSLVTADAGVGCGKTGRHPTMACQLTGCLPCRSTAPQQVSERSEVLWYYGLARTVRPLYYRNCPLYTGRTVHDCITVFKELEQGHIEY